MTTWPTHFERFLEHLPAFPGLDRALDPPWRLRVLKAAADARLAELQLLRVFRDAEIFQHPATMAAFNDDLLEIECFPGHSGERARLLKRLRSHMPNEVDGAVLEIRTLAAVNRTARREQWVVKPHPRIGKGKSRLDVAFGETEHQLVFCEVRALSYAKNPPDFEGVMALREEASSESVKQALIDKCRRNKQLAFVYDRPSVLFLGLRFMTSSEGVHEFFEEGSESPSAVVVLPSCEAAVSEVIKNPRAGTPLDAREQAFLGAVVALLCGKACPRSEPPGTH